MQFFKGRLGKTVAHDALEAIFIREKDKISSVTVPDLIFVAMEDVDSRWRSEAELLAELFAQRLLACVIA